MKQFFIWLILQIFFCFYAASPVAARSELYPVTPFAQVDGEVTGTVDGQAVQFEYHRTYHPDIVGVNMQTSRVRFASDGPVAMQLNFATPISGPYLQGIGRGYPLQQNGNQLTFTLPGPGHYYFKAGGLQKTILFWIDDLNAPRTKPGDPNVVDVTTRGIRNDPSANQKNELQALITAVPDGTILYFPAGVYRTGGLKISRKNLTLFFDRGALLKGTDNSADFFKGLIEIEYGRNIKLTGFGTIDANGMVTYSNSGGREIKIRNIQIDDSTDITLENLLFMDANSWSIHVHRSTNFTARNIKVFGGKDGIDPDSVTNALLENVFVQSVDDSIAVKSRDVSDNTPTNNVRVNKCIVSSGRATALKIGTENRQPITGVTFEHCDVIDSDRGMSIYTQYGGQIADVTYKNIRLTGVTDPWKNIPYSGGGPSITNLVYENIIVGLSTNKARINQGYPGLKKVMLKNIVIHTFGAPEERAGALRADAGTNVNAFGVTAYWNGKKGGWRGVFEGDGFVEKMNVVENDGAGPSMEFSDAAGLPPATVPVPPAEPTPACKIQTQVTCSSSTSVSVKYQFTQQPNFDYKHFIVRINAYPENKAECTNDSGQQIDWFCGRDTGKGNDLQAYSEKVVQETTFTAVPGVPYRVGVSIDAKADGTRLSTGQCAAIPVDITCTAAVTPTQSRKPGDLDRDNDVDIFDYNKLIENFGRENCEINLTASCLIDIYDYSIVLAKWGT